jgi:hypothetical protein
MTREVTDNLYIELGYFTPEEYYTYEANAVADFSTAATFTCIAEAGAVKDFSVAITATATQTTVNTRVINFVAPLGTAFNSTMTVDALRITEVTLISNAYMTTDFVVNRSATITLANIANVNAQAQRTANFDCGMDVSATLTAELTQVNYVDFSATLNASASATIVGKSFVTASPVIFKGVGKPEINYTTTKFGAGSLYLNGSSYLYAPDKNTRFDIPSSASVNPAGQFTVEAWIYPTAVNRTALIVGQWQGNSSSTQGWKLEQFNSEVTFTVRTGSSTTQGIGTGSSTPLNVDAWNHIAVVRGTNNGITDIAIWVNGVRRNSASWSNASFANTGEVRIGYSGETGTTYFQGYIDAVNFRVGSARYNTFTTPITLPTSEYSTINTTDKILVNFNDNYLDQSTPNTVAFTAQLNTAVTQTTTAEKVIIASAALSSAFTQTATALRIFEFDVFGLDSDTELTATAERILDFDAGLDSAATLSVDNLRTRNFDTALTTTATATAEATRILEFDVFGFDSVSELTATAATVADFDAGLDVTAALSVPGERIKQFSAQFDTVASQLTAAAKVGQALVTIESQFTQTTQATKTATADISVNTNFTQSASANLTRDFDAGLDTAFTQTTDIDVSSGAVVNLNTEFTQTAQGGLQQQAQSELNTVSTLAVSGQIVIVADSTQTVTAALTANANRTRSATAQFNTVATQLTATGIVVNKTALLSATTTLTAQAQRTRTTTVALQAFASQLTVGSEQSSAQAQLNSAFTLSCQTIEIRIDADLTYMVPKETRSYSISDEWRDDIIIPESRAYMIVEETRDYMLANTEETYII